MRVMTGRVSVGLNIGFDTALSSLLGVGVVVGGREGERVRRG